MSSRLFIEIADKLGLAYTFTAPRPFSGFRRADGLCRRASKSLEIGISAILEQLALLKEKISPEEVTKAKELSKGRLLLRMETAAASPAGSAARKS